MAKSLHDAGADRSVGDKHMGTCALISVVLLCAVAPAQTPTSGPASRPASSPTTQPVKYNGRIVSEAWLDTQYKTLASNYLVVNERLSDIGKFRAMETVNAVAAPSHLPQVVADPPELGDLRGTSPRATVLQVLKGGDVLARIPASHARKCDG
jgi:hypothetical protein